MNQKTLKNVIIGLLLVIIILLVLIYLYTSRSASTPSNAAVSTTMGTMGTMNTSSYPTIVRNATPVILESPYLYDSGYWVSPDTWWMSPDAGNILLANAPALGNTLLANTPVLGNTYVRNNYKTNNNYYYDKHSGGIKPIPSTTNALTAPQGIHPQPNPIPSATMGIQNILPTGNLVEPNQHSVFPLPTLAAPSGMMAPDAIAMNTVQSPIEMPHRQLPELVRNDIPHAIIADSMAAKVDIQASQLLGMRGGNNHLELKEP